MAQRIQYQLDLRNSWEEHLLTQPAVFHRNIKAAVPSLEGYSLSLAKFIQPSNAPELLRYKVTEDSGDYWLNVQEYGDRLAAVAAFERVLHSTSTPVLDPVSAGLSEIGELGFVLRDPSGEGPNLAIVFVRGNLLVAVQGLFRQGLDIGGIALTADEFLRKPPQVDRKPDGRVELSLAPMHGERNSEVLEIDASNDVLEESWLAIFAEDAIISSEGKQIIIHSKDNGRVKAEAFVQLGAGSPMRYRLR